MNTPYEVITYLQQVIKEAAGQNVLNFNLS